MVFKLKIFLNLCDLEKCFLTRFRNTLPMFGFTFKLYGGLNHMTFLFLFRLVFSTGASNFILLLNPLLFRADSSRGLALLNSRSLHDRFEIRFLVIDGPCLIMEGGWFDSEYM